MAGPESRALRHVFAAERAAAKIPGLPADMVLRKIAQVGVIGAGTVGDGITMNFLNAGIPVVLLETRRGERQPVGHSFKGPEIFQPTRFRRPSAQGCGDRLRERFSGPMLGAKSQGKTRSQSRQTTPLWAAINLHQAAAEPKVRVSG